MKRILLLLTGLFVVTVYKTQTFTWAKRAGSGTMDIGEAITTDAAGNVYITGFFQGTVDFDPGPGIANLSNSAGDDVFVAKYNSSGNFVWVKQFGGNSSFHHGKGIAVDGLGNVYTTGYFMGTVDFDPASTTANLSAMGQTDIFVSKLDPNGNYIWARRFGNTSADEGMSIAVDATGNVFTTGYFTGNVDFDPSTAVFTLNNSAGGDGFISKLDAVGNFVWAKQFGGSSGYTVINDLALDPSGNILTTGYIQSVTDFDPGPGSYTLSSVGGYDIFISKLDASGNFVWATSTGNISDDIGEGIDVDASGNVYTAGHFLGTVDFDPGAAVYNFTNTAGDDSFVSKLDASGNLIWVKQLTAGTSYENHAYDVAVDPAGNVFTTGFFGGTGDFDPSTTSTYTLTSAGGAYNIFVSKLDMNGNFVWACTMGSPSGAGSESRGISVDGSGNVYTTGWFNGTADFDPYPSVFNLTTAGNEDIFFHKMNDAITLSLKEEMAGFNAVIYPNPATSFLNIRTEETIEKISVYDLTGSLMLNERSNSFSVEHLPAGIYTLQIKTIKGIGTLRFVKE